MKDKDGNWGGGRKVTGARSRDDPAMKRTSQRVIVRFRQTIFSRVVRTAVAGTDHMELYLGRFGRGWAEWGLKSAMARQAQGARMRMPVLCCACDAAVETCTPSNSGPSVPGKWREGGRGVARGVWLAKRRANERCAKGGRRKEEDEMGGKRKKKTKVGTGGGEGGRGGVWELQPRWDQGGNGYEAAGRGSWRQLVHSWQLGTRWARARNVSDVMG